MHALVCIFLPCTYVWQCMYAPSQVRHAGLLLVLLYQMPAGLLWLVCVMRAAAACRADAMLQLCSSQTVCCYPTAAVLSLLLFCLAAVLLLLLYNRSEWGGAVDWGVILSQVIPDIVSNRCGGVCRQGPTGLYTRRGRIWYFTYIQIFVYICIIILYCAWVLKSLRSFGQPVPHVLWYMLCCWSQDDISCFALVGASFPSSGWLVAKVPSRWPQQIWDKRGSQTRHSRR